MLAGDIVSIWTLDNLMTFSRPDLKHPHGTQESTGMTNHNFQEQFLKKIFSLGVVLGKKND